MATVMVSERVAWRVAAATTTTVVHWALALAVAKADPRQGTCTTLTTLPLFYSTGGNTNVILHRSHSKYVEFAARRGEGRAQMKTNEVDFSVFLQDCAEEGALAHVMLADEGISQRELAQRMGVSEARVSQMLAEDCNPTVRTLVRMAHALGRRFRVQFVPTDPR